MRIPQYFASRTTLFDWSARAFSIDNFSPLRSDTPATSREILSSFVRFVSVSPFRANIHAHTQEVLRSLLKKSEGHRRRVRATQFFPFSIQLGASVHSFHQLLSFKNFPSTSQQHIRFASSKGRHRHSSDSTPSSNSEIPRPLPSTFAQLGF